jgi:hypothetical protein
MSRWDDEDHFASWLGLCPDNRITGGQVLRRGTRHVINRAATALRLAASTLLRSQSYLGAQYRRFRSKLGAPKAITAMASSPCWFTACCDGDKSTSIKACSTTRNAIANNKFTCSRSEPPSSGYKSSKRTSRNRERFLERFMQVVYLVGSSSVLALEWYLVFPGVRQQIVH